ncbi:unnamed protein product [Clonostachys rhizophaga]|uniref:SnoaL-like domain-containing protein n=1 Tax=Clonostachys rhizophaga TaxID=160324 RepID=A0A9N9V9N5_9HYPO|nr:unnamed protein product [Clonostachys rhizophaga]
MEPSATALSAHGFDYDSGVLDKPLANFIQRFYTLSDEKDGVAAWAACFAEDATLKKGDIVVVGRESLVELGQNSWNGQRSRLHKVSKVYPFSQPRPSEVMLHGVSQIVYDDQTTGELAWAAILQFSRSRGGQIHIQSYYIYPTALVKKA